MTTAAKDEHASGPPLVLPENRIWVSDFENHAFIGASSWVSSTLRWSSWQVYDETAVGRLVGLDFFGARYMSSAQGRFTSPDPFGGHIGDPQTLNRYAYGRNNPLRYTDSTGLDFYLDCKDKSDTCQGGRVGTTDDNGKFTATQISNDKDGGLVDQNGNQYAGNFDRHGVNFTDSNGNDYSGRFAANTAATTLSGSGIFSGFTGAFNGNGLNTNIAQGSLFGSPQAFQTLLKNLVGPNVGLDALNGFHPGTIQYRGGNDNGPDPHLSFDKSHLPNENGLLFQPFHFDGAYPFGGDNCGLVPKAPASCVAVSGVVLRLPEIISFTN